MKRLLALLLAFAVSSAQAGLETGTYVNDLVVTNPVSASDPVSQGADHVRLIKQVLKNTFPGMAGTFSRVQTKAGNYTGVLNDNSTLLAFTAVATLTLPDAATVGGGWRINIWANSTGSVTLSPSNGAQTVNGSATGIVLPGSYAQLFSDGSNFQVLYSTATGEPSGTIKLYAGTATPAGFLLCDGSAVSRTTYAALFTAIGTTWGPGDGSTTFNVPDFRRRVPVGSGGSGTGTLGASVGNTGGEETHTQTVAEMPSHAPTINDPGHTHNLASQVPTNVAGFTLQAGPSEFVTYSNVVTQSSVTGITLNNVGSGTPFNQMQPSAVVLYIVKF